LALRTFGVCIIYIHHYYYYSARGKSAVIA